MDFSEEIHWRVTRCRVLKIRERADFLVKPSVVLRWIGLGRNSRQASSD